MSIVAEVNESFSQPQRAETQCWRCQCYIGCFNQGA